MISEAISRVLENKMRRAEIGSLAGLKRAYEQELAANSIEIAAHVDRLMAMHQETMRRITVDGIRKHRRCEECGGPVEGQRFTRWYCSDRCRQRAHRKRQHAAAS